MTDVMIDLETLSTKPNAIILTIGAVRFDRNGPQKPIEELDTFYRRIQMQTCIEVGLHHCTETTKWWLSQDTEAKKEAFKMEGRVPLKEMLKEFTNWFGTNKNTKIWGHGDDFDCVVLGSAYRKCDMEPPWKFWNTRDTRTLFDICKFSLNELENTNHHHALYDAYTQALGVQICMNKIKV